MFKDLMTEIENMTEEQKEELLNTEFPEALEKEASAMIAQQEAADALYVIGALNAERAIAEIDGVEKIASEDLEAHEAAEAEVEELLEEALAETGVADTEDTIELHKEAQAAAGILFQGYADTLEKIAAAPGMGAKVKAHAKKALQGMKDAAKASGKYLKKHKGAAGFTGSLVAGYAGKKALEKKASDMTALEFIELNNDIAELSEGVEKLAAKGASMGTKVKALMRSAKKGAIKHRLPLGIAGGLATGAGIAHATQKKEK